MCAVGTSIDNFFSLYVGLYPVNKQKHYQYLGFDRATDAPNTPGTNNRAAYLENICTTATITPLPYQDNCIIITCG